MSLVLMLLVADVKPRSPIWERFDLNVLGIREVPLIPEVWEL